MLKLIMFPLKGKRKTPIDFGSERFSPEVELCNKERLNISNHATRLWRQKGKVIQ